ncbi:hypothetical protein PMI35_00967 [Pseudomonas sp. GM78]|nr:hypothetical protein PMI35_00967 [Pseudomonas sp. GM78]
MLSRLFAMVALIFSTSAFAVLPSAPFTPESVQEISHEFEGYVESFNKETAQLGAGTPQMAYVYGRYITAAFADAGYSLDETIYTYVSKARPNNLNMHRFIQDLNLGAILLPITQPAIADAYIQSGALTKRTYSFIADRSNKYPVTEADYILEGYPTDFPISAETEHSNFTEIGHLIEGKAGGNWDGWIVFTKSDDGSDSHAIGLVEVAKMDEGEKSILSGVVADKSRVKVEGGLVRNPRSDTFIDRSQDFLIKTIH